MSHFPQPIQENMDARPKYPARPKFPARPKYPNHTNPQFLNYVPFEQFQEQRKITRNSNKILLQRTPSPQYNAGGMPPNQAGYIHQMLPQQTQTYFPRVYGYQPLFVESKATSQRPTSTQEQAPQLYCKPKEKKHKLSIVDPNSGKDVTAEILKTIQSSKEVTDSGPRSTPEEAQDMSGESNAIAAQFAALVAAKLYHPPDGESPPSQTPPPSQRRRAPPTQEAVPGSQPVNVARVGVVRAPPVAERDQSPAHPVQEMLEQDQHLYRPESYREVISTREIMQVVQPQLSMLPKEILNMDSRSIELYNKALQEGEDNTHNIRLMIVGHYGVGKTTLKKRLFKESVDIQERKSTDGIDVRRCKILKNRTWLTDCNQTAGTRKALLHRIAKLMCNRNENETSEEKEQKHETSNYEASERKNTTRRRNKLQLKTESSETKQVADSIRDVPHENSCQTDTAGKQTDDSVRKKRHLEEFVKEVQHDHFIEDDVHCDLSLWDFAGQNIFYATHQAFLSRRAVYLLVLDVSKHIDDEVKDDIWHFDCQGEQQCKVTEFIEFWLNSIHEFCSIQGENGPSVILVGTFPDKLKQKSDADRCFYNLRSSLIGKVINCHLTEKQFYVDNTVEQDESLEALRQYIVKTASEQSYWSERIPAKWITLEERLIRLKEEQNVKVLQKDTLRKENRLLPVPIGSEAELDLFLKFHHECGSILYFGDEDLKDEILLDPQWLIDAFKSLITAAMFCICNPEIQEKWHKFDRSAVLTQDLIELIWTKDENREYLTHRKLILKFMEKLGFIARPKQCTDVSADVSKFEEYYFVPCMLKDPPPAKIISWNDSVHIKSTSKLCLTNAKEADKRFIPSTAFNRLISASINQWPLWIRNGKYMIFCGGAVFQLENNHFLYIFLYEHVIQIWITRLSMEGQNPTVSLCRKTQNQIKKILDENVRMRRMLLSFVKCTRASLYSNEDMVELQEERSIHNREIPCCCQDKEHVVSYVDMVKYWLPEDRIPRLGQALSLDLESKPSEKDFSRISRRIGKEYKQVAYELGLSQPEIDHICMDNNTAADKITAVLCRWSKRMDEKATYGELVKALQEAGVDVVSVFGG